MKYMIEHSRRVAIGLNDEFNLVLINTFIATADLNVADLLYLNIYRYTRLFMIYIDTLLAGQPQTITDERGSWRSTIFRTPVVEPVLLEQRGLLGDQVADTENHGTLDQAVCCHPRIHYEYWNNVYDLHGDKRLGPGVVGENWTLSNVAEEDVCIGDIYAVGSARVQVSAPRYPCSKQERKVCLPGFLRLTMETLRTGWYLRVIVPGIVQVGERLVLEARSQPELTIQRINANMHGDFDPKYAELLLEVPELANGWKRILRYKLGKDWQA
jgi:MOSC domain-containing protein YiiM